MEKRLQLHEELCSNSVLGSRNAYFQPPESIKLYYPCIIYKLSQFNIHYADDLDYLMKKRYELIVITSDPDDNLAERVLKHFPGGVHERRYVADNLYHDLITIYY